MAEFNSYLLGKVTKSVGNITLVYTKRKNIAKAKVFKRKDNPTPEILEQRTKMKTLVQFGRRILPVVRKGFAGVGRGTAFNAFVALNMDKVSFGAGSVATIDYGRLLLASGLLVTPRVTVGYDEESGTYTFSQTAQEPEEGFASLADKVYGVLLETALQRVRIVALNNRGVAGETEYALPEEWEASKVEVYCFATSPNGRMVSDSMHLTV